MSAHDLPVQRPSSAGPSTARSLDQNDEAQRDEAQRDEIRRDEIRRDEIRRDEIRRDEIRRDEIRRDEALYLDWQSHCLPLMAIDDRYFVVECAELANELDGGDVSPMQAGAIVLDRGLTGLPDRDDVQRIEVRFFVDETHDQLVRCRFGQLDAATREDLRQLRHSIQEDDHELADGQLDDRAAEIVSPTQVATPPHASESRRPRRGLRSVVLAGGLFAVCFAAFSMAKPEPKTVAFNHAALATLAVPLKSSSEGQVTELMVEVGDQVRTGDAIARLKVLKDNGTADVLSEEINDGNRQLIVLEQQRTELEKAVSIAREKAELDREFAQTELRKARAMMLEEKAKLRRLAPLILDGNISDAEVDQINAVIEKAKAAMEQAQIELKRLTLITEAADQDILVTPEGIQPMSQLSSEITQLRAKVQRLTAQRSRMKFEPAEKVVVASESGIVQTLHLEIGSAIRAGDKTLTVTQVDPNWVVGLVDAGSLAQLKIGQTVSVQLPKDEIEVQGTVKAIGDAPGGEAVPVRVSVEAIDGMVSEGQLAADTPLKITMPVEQPSRLARWIADFKSPENQTPQASLSEKE